MIGEAVLTMKANGAYAAPGVTCRSVNPMKSIEGEKITKQTQFAGPPGAAAVYVASSAVSASTRTWSEATSSHPP